MTRRDSDQHYVIDLVDEVLGLAGIREHRFPFLLGDPGRSGRCARLPVDAFYPGLNLVVEFHEVQHRKPIAHFDKPHRMTLSGVHRGEQRRIYDERRRAVLPANGLTLLEIGSDQLRQKPNERLARDIEHDRAELMNILAPFIKSSEPANR